MKHQTLDIDTLHDVVLDGKWVRTRVSHVTGEAGIDVVEQHDPESHAVRHLAISRCHYADAAIPFTVIHSILPAT